MESFGKNLVELLPRLRRFAISLCRSRETADELIQTACAKALAARNSWEPGTRFDSWMFRILRNAWIDSLRQKQREGFSADIADHEDSVTADGETEIMAKFELQSVTDAIGQLPAEQREVLILVCVEDYSYAEAAAVLELPLGTVMSRLARAREKIAWIAGIEMKSKR